MKHKAKGGWDFQPSLARSHHEAGVCIANTRGELTKCTRGACVAVGTEQNFAGARVTFFGKGDMADAFVAFRANIVKVRQILLCHKCP